VANVNANISVVVNTTQAMSQVRALQSEINILNKTLATSGGNAATQMALYNKAMMDAANRSGMFSASMVPVQTSVERFNNLLDKNKFSLGQYTKYAASQLPGMSKVFKREFDTMTKVAEDRVKRLQTQYTALGNSQKALALTPRSLDMGAFATQSAVAAQRQMLFNKMISDGSTKLLNWGKNTQWAGRQLMVGFSLPLAAFGAVAAKTFMQLDKQARDFKRVYGDAFTAPSEIQGNLDAIKSLGIEYTKYGIKLEQTMNVAATAAAAGMKNQQLMSGTEESLRLATIGQIDYQQALTTTISLQNAFKISNEELAPTVDFIGAVANQTVLSVDDMTKAIPRVAPVVAGLGGSVKDLAALLVAMREGGVSAEQGANALKSGLASLINPTKNAQNALKGLGIDLDAIVQANRGDLMGTINQFAQALSTLDKFSRQQALEKVFGKFQYARLGALFDNIIKKGGQADTALKLAGASAEELGAMSAKSLNEVEKSTTAKFQGAVERMKVAIAPVGEAFLKALTPVISFISNIAEKFNDLPDTVKSVFTTIVAVVAGVGPVALMFVGLIANGIANVMKLSISIRKFFAWLRKDSAQFNILSAAEDSAAASTAALEGSASGLTETLLIQKGAVEALITLYGQLAESATVAAAAMPKSVGAAMVAGKGAGKAPLKFANGTSRVPGSGNGDTVPALLTPGESVVTKSATKKYGPIIAAMNAGTLQGFNGGLIDPMLVQSAERSYANRSHTLALTPETIAQTLSAGLDNPRVSAVVAESLEKAVVRGISIAGNQASLAGRVNISNKEGLANVSSLATGKFAGTSFISPQQRNSAFLESPLLPQGVRGGEALLQEDYLRQLRVAQGQEIQAAEVKAEVKQGALQFAEEAAKLEQEGLLKKENEVKFLERRLTLMAEQEQIDQGIITDSKTEKQLQDAKIAREKKAASQISEMKKLGLIRGNQITDPAGINQLLAAKAISANQSVAATSGQGFKNQGRIVKRIALGKQELLNAGAWLGTKLTSSPETRREFPGATDQLTKRKIKSAQSAARAESAAYNAEADALAMDAYDRGRKKANRHSPNAKAGPDGSDDQRAYNTAAQAEAKKAWKTAQSASRREAYNIARMQSAGMNDTQILRALEKAEQVKKRGLVAAQRAAALAEQNAQLTVQTNVPASQEVAAKRGMLGKVKNWWNKPTGNGSNTMGGRVSSGASAATMGLMGLSMAASMAGGSVGEMAQKIMPVTMGLMGLQMVIPMLTNPIGLATVAASALVAGFIYLRTQLDNAAKSAANVGANLGGVANGMKIIADATGFKGKSKQDNLFRFTDQDRKAMSEFSGYFESDAGKKFITDLQSATSEERYQKVAFMLSQAVASGMDKDKAKAFGQAIAQATGDSLLNSSLMSDFAKGVFNAGSQALIDIEKNRLQQRPELNTNMTFAQKQQTAMNVELPIWQNIADGLVSAITGDTGPFRQAAADTAISLKPAAEALGYVLQVSQDLSNAEAVLEDERKNGLITTEEYTRRLNELNGMQKDQTDYLGQILSLGADAGAMAQALGDQLTLQGFSGDQSKLITEKFNADALAQKFFQVDYSQIDVTTEQGKAQQKYIQEVFNKVMSGLTPENAAQRMNDIEGTYKNIAGEVVDAIQKGTQDGLDYYFNKQNIQDWIKNRLGAQTTGGNTGIPSTDTSGNMAENLMSQEKILKDLGTGVLEVQNALNGFKDSNFALSILKDTGKIKELGIALKELKDFKTIDIELVMKQGIDPVKLASSLSRMAKITVNKDVKGILLNPEVYANIGMEMGKSVATIEAGYSSMANSIDDTFLKAKANTKALKGDIKGVTDQLLLTKGGDFVINTKFVTTMWGKEVAGSDIPGILNDAFPDGLDPIKMQLIMQAVMDPVTRAMISANPKAFEAAMKGETSYTSTSYQTGGGVSTKTTGFSELGGDAGAFFNSLAAGVSAAGEYANGGQSFNTDKKKNGGGATDIVKEFSKSIMDRMKLYTNMKDVAKQFKGAKDAFEKTMMASGYKGSFVDTLRKMNLSESFVADLLSQGYDNAKKIVDKLGKKKLLQLNAADLVAGAAQTVSENIGKARVAVTQQRLSRNMISKGISSPVAQSILGDQKKSEQYTQLMFNMNNTRGKENEQATKKFWEFVNAEKAAVDEAKNLERAMNPIQTLIDDATTAYEQNDKQMQYKIEDQQLIIDGIQKEIDALEEANHIDQNRIRDLERQKEVWQREIDAAQHLNDLDQQKIDSLQRQDEIRNRTSSAISHDLEIMSQKENNIREQYDARVKALETVSAINQHIIDQQNQQLGLAQALSQGDVYAAAQAQQQMQAANAQYAMDQTRLALQTGMENQIAGLTTSGGLTKAQAEKQINDIKEQSYQTSLQIRDIEDVIYQRNLDMLPIKDKIYNQDLAIRAINDDIYNRESQINTITDQRLTPAQKILTNLEEQQAAEKRILERKIDGLQLILDQSEMTDAQKNSVAGLADEWHNVAEQIKLARDIAKTGRDDLGAMPKHDVANGETAAAFQKKVSAWQTKLAEINATEQAAIAAAQSSGMNSLNNVLNKYSGGKIMKYGAGSVVGSGGMDSVSAMLTPGEYVMRKASVDKYGTAMLDKMNMGAFSMPRYNVKGGQTAAIKGSHNVSSISAPVYNTYSINVPVTQPGASADEIANKVMTKIKSTDNASIRRINGY
jgi:TP901 family phage tail tape measure protein